MPKPTQILSDEHQNILKVINALLKEGDLLQQNKDLDKSFFAKAVDFIRNYADKFHHAKEEDILFKELGKDSVQMHCNPIDQMLYEHDLGRNFVKGLVDALEKDDKLKVIENARGYALLLQDHIFKEDNILYPMADQALSQSDQESIGERFKQVEEKFNQEKDKYLNIVKELTGE